MKRNLPKLFCLFSVSLMLFSSCDIVCLEGKGSLKSEKRDIRQFNGIRLKVPAQLIVEQSDTLELLIEAQDNIIRAISTTVSDETLNIETKECIGTNDGITIHIKVPEIKKLIISGYGNISSSGKIKGEHLELGINGSGFIDANVDLKSIYGGIRGSGGINLKGNADEQYIKLSGSGNYKAIELATVRTDADINGSGEISLYVLEKLKANVNGSGNIRYKGSPKTSIKISGSGSVNKVE